MKTSCLVAVLAVIVFIGCDKKTDPSKPKPAAHNHPTTGPHGGQLVEWGEEEYHLELLMDRKGGEATVYVLDGSAVKAAPIKAKDLTMTLKAEPPVTLKLAAKPETGDPAGSSSRFTGKSDALSKDQPLTGTINGEVEGKPYTGDFAEKK
jgi:hypothetical protein